jgi:hypothetical protein
VGVPSPNVRPKPSPRKASEDTANTTKFFAKIVTVFLAGTAGPGHPTSSAHGRLLVDRRLHRSPLIEDCDIPVARGA